MNGLAVSTTSVLRIVSFGHVPAIIDDREISAMKQIASSGATYGPYPYLTVGQWVEVQDGPLQGVNGIIVRVKNKDRVIVSIDLLMRSVFIEIENCRVSPLLLRKGVSTVGGVSCFATPLRTFEESAGEQSALLMSIRTGT
jgi:hypothetical protein